MKLSVSLSAVDEVTFNAFHERLPSLTNEQIIEQAQRLGQIPLCKESLGDKLFAAGMQLLKKGYLDSAVHLANAQILGEAYKDVQNMIQVVIDLKTAAEAKLPSTAKNFGKDSREYAMGEAGIEMINNVLAHMMINKRKEEKPPKKEKKERRKKK